MKRIKQGQVEANHASGWVEGPGIPQSAREHRGPREWWEGNKWVMWWRDGREAHRWWRNGRQQFVCHEVRRNWRLEGGEEQPAVSDLCVNGDCAFVSQPSRLK